MTSMVEDVCMESSSPWTAAGGCLVACLSPSPSFPKKPSPAAKRYLLTSSSRALNKISSCGDLHEESSGVGIRIALQPAPHACIFCCHTGLKTSKHAQPFARTSCPVLFLTFPLRDRSTSDEEAIQIIWSLGTPTKGKNNNSSAAFLICIENSDSFFADPSGLPYTAVKLYVLNPERNFQP